MHDSKTINKALNLLEKYDYQYSKVSRQLNIHINTLRSWVKKKNNNISLNNKTRNRKSRWTDEEKSLVVEYYFSHGENILNAQREFGYPSYSMLKRWVKADKRWKQKHFVIKTPVSYNETEKQKIVVELASRTSSAANIANKYDVCRETLYLWQKEMAGGPIMVDNTQKSKDELQNEIERLKQEQKALQMENEILKKANELLKKEIGANYTNLSNKDKTMIISALKDKFSIKNLIKKLDIKKSTYFYEAKKGIYDKYEYLRGILKVIFESNYACYGYRRMKQALLNEYGLTISEKVILRLMKEENLIVYKPKSKKKYSSYAGEITPEVPNILNRDFKATMPHQKALTDITEFALKDGKVYLSPMIDCYDGLPITWTIGTSPNSLLADTMLTNTFKIVGNKSLLIHSDRGVHYRTYSWIDKMNEYGYIRSMSKKGCSPDNSMGEGFFGTLKNEFFYSKDWSSVCTKEFIPMLDDYLNWFKNKRIKMRLVKNI